MNDCTLGHGACAGTGKACNRTGELRRYWGGMQAYRPLHMPEQGEWLDSFEICRAFYVTALRGQVGAGASHLATVFVRVLDKATSAFVRARALLVPAIREHVDVLMSSGVFFPVMAGTIDALESCRAYFLSI